jgi:SAM-dependent methyltransferase
MAFYRGWLDRYAPRQEPRRVHDLGCAFGRFLASLPDGWEPFGSDASEHALAEARRLCPRGTFAPSAPSPRPPFAVPMSAVTAWDVIEHIPDLAAVAASVQAQLVDGGAFLFVVPVYDGLSGPVIRRLDRDPTHLHKWPRRQWLDWAGAAFEVCEWVGIVRYLLPGGYYVHVPTRRARDHTPAILVACRKRPA